MAQPSCTVAASLAPLSVETHLHTIGGSGLLANGDDAQRRFARLLASVDPDAVAALYVGNYIGPPASDGAGRPIAADTPEFFAAWQERAHELSEAREGRRRRALLGAAAAGARLARRGAPVRGVRHARRRHVAVGRGPGRRRRRVVDDKPECADGEPLRNGDGLHLTPAGTDVFPAAPSRTPSPLPSALRPSPPPADPETETATRIRRGIHRFVTQSEGRRGFGGPR